MVAVAAVLLALMFVPGVAADPPVHIVTHVESEHVPAYVYSNEAGIGAGVCLGYLGIFMGFDVQPEGGLIVFFPFPGGVIGGPGDGPAGLGTAYAGAHRSC